MKLFGILTLILAFSFSAFAQTIQPTPPNKVEDEGEVLRIESRLVVVPVSIVDANGQPVLGLKAQDFRVLEENKSQQIQQVSDAEKVPLEIALLIDVSSSVNKIFELEKSAAAQFLQGVMRPEDRATIFLITDKPVLLQSRETAEKSSVNVRSIAQTKSSTAFYDTVTTAARYLNANAQPRSRRVILSLSDGEDNYSEITRNPTVVAYKNLDINKLTQKDLDQRDSRTAKAHTQAQAVVLKSLQNTDTVFYTINPSGPSVRLNLASRRAQNALQQFADETGGTAFLPQFVTEKNSASFEKQNIQILDNIFRQISAELRAQYLLQYYSEADFPTNKYVKLDVSLQNPQSLRVRARQGYFVKN
ncbi:MAG: VWA domain-containing protein [Acidobacteriota bacterium]|jgi:Ca-activated chloride channel family protein|nr:VWA domain-containing protein [Acidobacteriota bacterium]